MQRLEGKYFSQQEIDKVKQLLSTTDMTLQEIAMRMGCSKSSIVSINRTFQIRDYHGRRSFWSVANYAVS